MELYETGQTLAQIKAAKAEIERRVKTIKASVPADDPFAAQAAKEKLNELYRDYDDFVTEENNQVNLSKSLLASGKFIHEGPNMIPQPGEIREAGFKVPEVKDKMKAHIAYSLGVDPSNVDLDSGAPWGARMKAAFFSAEKKPDFYKSEFGDDNVVTLQVAGKPVNFIKQGDKLIMADEQDFVLKDLADVAGGVTSEVLPTAGAIGGGIVGAPSVPGAAIASGAGYTAGGTISDWIAEAAMMKEDKRRGFGDVLGKRSMEGMIGMPVEIGIGLATKPLAKRLGPQASPTTAVRTMDDALKNLEKRGRINKQLQKKLAPFVDSSNADHVAMLQIAQKSPTGGMGRAVYSARELLQDFREKVASKEPDLSKKLYESSARRFIADQEVAIARIGEVNSELATRLNKELRQKASQILDKTKTQPVEALGVTIRNLVADAENHAIKAERGAFDSFFTQADEAGLSFDPEELANVIQIEYAKNLPGESSVITKTIDRLRSRRSNAQMLADLESRIPSITDPALKARAIADAEVLRAESGPVTARQFRTLFKEIRDDAPAGHLVSPSGAQFQGRTIANRLNDLFQERVVAAGLDEKWLLASQDLEKRMGFEGGILASILKDEAGGGGKLSPQQILDRIMVDTTHVDKVLSAVRTVSPQMEEPLRMQMQNAYLQQIGIGRDVGTGMKAVDFDDNMVLKLWGVNPKGQVNEVYGQLMIDKLKTLNSELKKLQVDPAKVSNDDIMALQNVLSADGIKETTQLIAKRAAEKQKVEIFENNELIKTALSSARRGNMSIVDIDRFPKAVFEERNTGRIGELVSYMEPSDLAAFKDHTMGHFFRRYAIEPASVKNDFGYTPWDVDKFLMDVETNPALATNLKKIVGADAFDDLVELSRMGQVVRPVIVDKSQPVAPRIVTNTTKASIYIAGDIPRAVRSTYLQAAYSSGQLSPTLRKLVGRRVSQQTYDENMKRMNGALFGTARGMEAAFLAGRRDPAFLEFFANNGLAPEWMQDVQDFREEYGTDTGLDINNK